MIRYSSTRGGDVQRNFNDVLLSGMARDGGLFIPDSWPTLPVLSKGMAYSDVAHAVMQPFVEKSIKTDHFRALVEKTYPQSFTHPAVAPLVEIGPNEWLMELFHGPTLAFKDYALQLLGGLFEQVLDRRGERVTIVGATSGDTGSAAIEACRGCAHIDIFILHPKGRTSEVQRRQMTTVDAPNVYNIALEGSFDDCQSLVKAMFADEAFRGDMNLSAVNSINWARVMAQIVYYVNAALTLNGASAPVSFAVPTGNFGNIYAAYVARQMGLPIDQLIIGSNRNDILTRFFETGTMQAQSVEPSLSPSMDIQISSNFERYLCDLLGRDRTAVAGMMGEFRTNGAFSVTSAQKAQANADFTARRCNDDDTLAMMRACYKETGYMIDPHTAVGLHAARQARANADYPLVALACAHPAKFPDAVEQATGIRPPLPPNMADLFERQEHVSVLPNDLKTVQDFIKANKNS